MNRLIGILLVLLLTVFSEAQADEEGVASYYADSLHGNPTASGEPYDKDALTAAKRHEADVLSDYGAEEAHQLKKMLQTLIERNGAPAGED